MPYLDTIKVYFYAIVAFVVTFFGVWFKMRGMTIEDQQREIDAHEANDVAQDFEADNRVDKAKAEAEDVEDMAVGTYHI